MFRLMSSGPERSDCTAPYDAVLDRAVKLAEADGGWTAMDYILYV